MALFNMLIYFQFKMMRQRMTLQEIYQYLGQKNFNLSSDKILRDPLGNPDIIWNILTFLTQNIRDTKFDQIQPTLSYLLDDSHKNSLRKIKQYTILCETFKKIYHNNQQYPIKEILKPEKQFVFEKISTLICANKYWQKITKQYESIRTSIRLKRLQIQQLRKKLETKNLEIQEMKLIKQKQRSAFEQKHLSIQNLSKDFNYKKKQKLDLLNSQLLLEAEQKKKVKYSHELEYDNDDMNIKIKQLERQIIRNAPKLKKERFGLIEKYQSLVKRNRDHIDLWTTKINVINQKIKLALNVKQKSKTFKIQKKFKQLSSMTQKFNALSAAVSQGNESKQSAIGSKKQFLKSMQMLQKRKKEIIFNIAQEEKHLGILKRGESIMRDEQRLNKKNVKTLQQKNAQSLNQYRALRDKIKYKRQKLKQKIFEHSLKLKNIEQESKRIMEETFSEFN